MPNPFPPALIQAPVNTFLLTDKIVGVRPGSFEGLQNTAQCVTSGTDTIDLERYIVEVCYVA